MEGVVVVLVMIKLPLVVEDVPEDSFVVEDVVAHYPELVGVKEVLDELLVLLFVVHNKNKNNL